MTQKIEMTVQKAKGRKANATGWVMYGRLEYDSWFERWYPTREAAEKYAAKRGWLTGSPSEVKS